MNEGYGYGLPCNVYLQLKIHFAQLAILQEVRLAEKCFNKSLYYYAFFAGCSDCDAMETRPT